MPVAIAVLAILISSWCAFVVRAQSAATPELKFVRAFIDTCLQHFPDIESVRRTANTLKWPAIEDPKLKAMVAPADPRALWQGWLMKADGNTFVVGTAESIERRRSSKSCSFAADGLDLPSVYRTFEQLVSLEKQLDFIENGQRNQLWIYARDAERFALMATDGAPMKINTLSLAITNAQPKGR
jgi:hypothetical protein